MPLRVGASIPLVGANKQRRIHTNNCTDKVQLMRATAAQMAICTAAARQAAIHQMIKGAAIGTPCKMPTQADP